jgi:hypothetical protein
MLYIVRASKNVDECCVLVMVVEARWILFYFFSFPFPTRRSLTSYIEYLMIVRKRSVLVLAVRENERGFVVA